MVIKQYENPINGLSPGDSGAGAVARAASVEGQKTREVGDVFGRVVNAAGGLAQDYRDKVERAKTTKEVSDGFMTLAVMEDNLYQSLQDKLKGADPSEAAAITAKWREEELIPALENFRGGFETEAGQTWAAEHAASSFSTLFRTTTADAANLAAIGFTQKIEGGINQMAENVSKDPGSLDTNLSRVDETFSMVGQNEAFDAENAAKLKVAAEEAKAHLVESAMASAMDADPEGFLKELDAGKWDKYVPFLSAKSVDGLTIPTLEVARKRAQGIIKQREVETRTAEAAADKERRTAINKATADLYSSAIGDDGSFSLTPDYWTKLKEISKMPGVTDSDMSPLVEFGKKIQKGDDTTTNDPATFADFSRRMFLPDNDPNKLTAQEIYRAGTEGKLVTGEKGMGLFLGGIKAGSASQIGSVEGDMLKNAAHLYDPPNYLTDGVFPTDDDRERAKRYQEWFMPTYLRALKAGKTPQELLDPTSPDYLPNKFSTVKGSSSPLLYPTGVPAPPNAVPSPDLGGSATPPASLPPLTPENFWTVTPEKTSFNPADDFNNLAEPDERNPDLSATSGDIPTDAELITYQMSGIRRLEASPELKTVLTSAATSAGVKVVVYSGGQKSNKKGEGKGSTRHNHGDAADINLYRNGKILDFDNPSERPYFEAFIRSAIAAGATGIGAGRDYMGTKSIHVGFGPNGKKGGPVLLWGAGGHVANAPSWLSALNGTQMASK